MVCADCQEFLSDYLDGLLELGENAQVEHHLAACSDCRMIRDDLLHIIHFSRQLPLHTPSNAVWNSIAAEIDSDDRRSRFRRLWGRVSGYQFRMSLPQLAVSATAFTLIFTAALVVSSSNRAANRPEPASVEANKPTSAAVQATMLGIEHRINRLEATAEERRSSWHPELRAVYDRQMLNVDQSLAECLHGLSDNPNDNIYQELMLNAYREKVRLLEEFVEY